MNPSPAITLRLADALRASLTYVPSNSSHDYIREALAAYDAASDSLAVADLPGSTTKPSLHVFLDDHRELEPGDSPSTFTFNTEGEKEAFIEALGVVASNSDFDYSIVENPDYRIDSEGEIRRFPAGADPERPIIDYVMRTADGCEKTIVYALSSDGKTIELEPGTWAPENPEAETITVDINVRSAYAGAGAELEGDQHRDLESSGSLDAFLVALADGNPDRANTILEEASQSMGARP